MGFDIDSCCFGFTGTRVIGLPRAIRAIVKSQNLIDPSRMSKTYESRLAKYARRGFAVAVPGFSRPLVKKHIFTMPIHKLSGLAILLRLEVLDLMKISKPKGLRGSYAFDYHVTNETRMRDGLRGMNCSQSAFNQIYEYQMKHGTSTCDYSSVFIPQGPRWNSMRVLGKLLKYRQRIARSPEFPACPFVFGVANGGQSEMHPLTHLYDTSLVEVRDFVWGGNDFNFDDNDDDEDGDSLMAHSIPRTVEWMVDNPGKQGRGGVVDVKYNGGGGGGGALLSGSFNPIDGEDWFADAFGLKDADQQGKK